MGRKAEVAWQVLQDEDAWSEGVTHPEIGPGLTDRQRAGGTNQRDRPWLSLALASLLLLILAWWMAAQYSPLPTASASNGVSPRPVSVQQWEGDYFVFTYSAADVQAVIDKARTLEARYGQLRRALGVAARDEEPKIPLSVEKAALAEEAVYICRVLGTVQDETVAQALPPAGATGSWQIAPAFVSGLRGWTELQLCPSSLAERRQEIETEFASVPGLPRLQELRPGLYSYPYRGESPGQTARDGLAFVILIEYAVQTYGVGRLPLFLTSLQQPVTWDELIPAVFDVSAEEFEMDWRAWLAKEYGV